MCVFNAFRQVHGKGVFNQFLLACYTELFPHGFNLRGETTVVGWVKFNSCFHFLFLLFGLSFILTILYHMGYPIVNPFFFKIFFQIFSFKKMRHFSRRHIRYNGMV
nr:MAG TPA: hypothetical protein [Caudoviricetes sp.]